MHGASMQRRHHDLRHECVWAHTRVKSMAVDHGRTAVQLARVQGATITVAAG